MNDECRLRESEEVLILVPPEMMATMVDPDLLTMIGYCEASPVLVRFAYA